jgi:hypothetical protein
VVLRRVLLPVAGLLLAGCAVATPAAAPLPEAMGHPALDPLVTLSVVACQPLRWCIAAGTNPTSAAVGSASVEISAGGHGKWAKVNAPSLDDATLSTAACWASGCLLGGADARGPLLEIVNPKKRDASIESARLPGISVAALACPTAGRCLALVTTQVATSVWQSTTSGSSWHEVHALPATPSTATSLSCPTARVCVAAGTGPTGAEAARTSDGGARWSLAALPPGLEVFTAVSCGPSWCMATARLRDGRTELLQSRNRGASWARFATSLARPEAVACVTATTCVAAGSGSGGGAIASYRRPGVEHVLTIEFVPDPLLAVACASVTHCAGITQASTVSFSPS